MGTHFLRRDVPVVVVALLLQAVPDTLGAADDEDGVGASGGINHPSTSRGGRVLHASHGCPLAAADAAAVPGCSSHRTFRSWRRHHFESPRKGVSVHQRPCDHHHHHHQNRLFLLSSFSF